MTIATFWSFDGLALLQFKAEISIKQAPDNFTTFYTNFLWDYFWDDF